MCPAVVFLQSALAHKKKQRLVDGIITYPNLDFSSMTDDVKKMCSALLSTVCQGAQWSVRFKKKSPDAKRFFLSLYTILLALSVSLPHCFKPSTDKSLETQGSPR